jgi:hypothetical protein
VSGTVAVSATGSDDVGVTRVEFFANGVLVGKSAGPTYMVSWHTAALPNGPVTLMARALDGARNQADSPTIQITVDNVPPVVTLHPSPQTVTAGQTASFSAAASGTPAPGVQWQMSADGGGSFNDVLGATSTTLSFSAYESDNGKRYRAVFMNSSGAAITTEATLYVNPSLPAAPIVTLKANGAHPLPPVVTTSGPFKLTLDMSASTWTGSLDWYEALVLNGQLYWVTPTGLSTIAEPVLQSPPIILTDHALLDVTLPPGTTATSLFFLLEGGTIVSLDWITVTVSNP